MDNKIKKIAIIVGHGNGDSGAMGWNGMSEFNYNQFVADELSNLSLGKEITVFYKTDTGRTGLALKVIMFNPDLSIELHLNAYNGTAKGCEVLCLEDDLKSQVFAKSFVNSFCEKFSRTKRQDEGVKRLKKMDRGFLNLNNLKILKNKILIEPFFIDNKNEWIEPMNYCNFLAEWIKGL